MKAVMAATLAMMKRWLLRDGRRHADHAELSHYLVGSSLGLNLEVLNTESELRTELHFVDFSLRNGAQLCWCPWCRSWPSVTSAAERLAVKVHLDDNLIIP